MKTHIDKAPKRELNSVAQNKCKYVQKMFDQYGYGCMITYGWHRFEKNVVPKRDSDWLKYILQKNKGIYIHTGTSGETYNMLIDGIFRIDIIKRIIKGTFENCNIKGEILNIRYHRLNCRTAGQKEDEFDNKVKGQMQQVTLIIPFTKLNVMVETKTKNVFSVKKTEMVHCYTKPHAHIFIAQNM